jgi:hypothetical protein
MIHNQSMQNKGIKLVAHDSETVHFLSALLQDGISCGVWILYKNDSLKILINRVCWEKPKEIMNDESHIQRLHSILTVHNIISIKTKNVCKKKIEFFSILSIICEYDSKKQVNILKILLSKGTISITVSDFHVTMKDVSTYWLSKSIPSHI